LHISFPEALGFYTKAEKPFQTHFLHEAGRLHYFSDVKVEGSSHRNDKVYVGITSQFGGKLFLLGSTDSYPHDINIQSIDLVT